MDNHEDIVRWTGELLWPQILAEADTIDLSGVTALGSWVHAWFAARPGQGVAGAIPQVRAQLDHAAVGICWRDPTRIINGVTRAERLALFANEI